MGSKHNQSGSLLVTLDQLDLEQSWYAGPDGLEKCDDVFLLHWQSPNNISSFEIEGLAKKKAGAYVDFSRIYFLTDSETSAEDLSTDENTNCAVHGESDSLLNLLIQ